MWLATHMAPEKERAYDREMLICEGWDECRCHVEISHHGESSPFDFLGPS